MSHSPRRGFSLVEVLVVIAVVAALIGLLLPAVQKAREAANRSRCANKMKQLVTGCHTYHAAFGRFPTGADYVPEPGTSSTCPNNTIGASVYAGSRSPWTVQILPHIEQDPLYRQFVALGPDLEYGGELNSNVSSALGKLQISPNKAFWCPSDPKARGAWQGSSYLGVSGGGTNLATASDCRPTATSNSFNTTHYMYLNGIFYYSSKTRIVDVTDGSSTTYIMAESKYMVDTPASRAGAWAGAIGITDGNTRSWRNLTQAVFPINQKANGGDYGPDDLRVDNFIAAAPTLPTSPGTPGLCIGSFHTQGANLAFADGSVRFVRETIDITTHRAMGTRARGETLQETP